MTRQILLGGFLQPDPNGDPQEVYTLCVDDQIEPERSREFIVHVRIADRTIRLTLERVSSGWCCRVTLPKDSQVQIDKADLPDTVNDAPIDPSVDFILNGPGEEMISPGETLAFAMAKLDEALNGDLFKDTLRKP